MASNRGAAGAPQARVMRASGWRSIKCLNKPVERIASPIRVEVMNKIFKAAMVRQGCAPGSGDPIHRSRYQRSGEGAPYDRGH